MRLTIIGISLSLITLMVSCRQTSKQSSEYDYAEPTQEVSETPLEEIQNVEQASPDLTYPTNISKSTTNKAVMPSYPGGINAFRNYLKQNIKYPQAAKDAEIEDIIQVAFTVETDGSLSNIHTKNTAGYGLEEEAIRIIANSNKWNPGIINGKPVKVRFTVPINFKIN